MEPMDTVTRKKEFKSASKFDDVTVNDSRFGLRKLTLNRDESPSIFSYKNVGRGVQGEHQN